ncbi:hypothetical protein GCM10027448_36980 [Nocardioides dilutus]
MEEEASQQEHSHDPGDRAQQAESGSGPRVLPHIVERNEGARDPGRIR